MPVVNFFPSRVPEEGAVCWGKRHPKLWGWTEEDAQRAVIHHLVRSSYHYCDEAEARALTEQFVIEEGTMEASDVPAANLEEELDVPAAEPTMTQPKKRAKPATPPSMGQRRPYPTDDASPTSGAAASTVDVALVARIVSETMRQMPPAALGQQPTTAFSASAGTMAALGGGSSSGSSFEPPIQVRRSQVQAIIDCCQRAGLAARQAQMLSLSAERAFESEGMALDACKENLQSLLR